MTISQRLREERLRLGLSQVALSSIAGASKSAVISWEKGTSAPTAPALAEMAAAGLDTLYILTGRRTADRPDDVVARVEDYLAAVRRDMLSEARTPMPGEDDATAEARMLREREKDLRGLLREHGDELRPDLVEEIESVLAILDSPIQLAAYRAADHVQRRAKRKQMRETIRAWTDLGEYQPGDGVINVMTTVALDYAVPVSLLIELMIEIMADDNRPNLSADYSNADG
jgi:transcriptional regulator with XRE-family HTH domain